MEAIVSPEQKRAQLNEALWRADIDARAKYVLPFDLLGKTERAQVIAGLDPKYREIIARAEAVDPQIEAAARQIATGEVSSAGSIELVDTIAQARVAREAEERMGYEAQGPAATALRIATGSAPPSETDAIARRIAGVGE